MVRVLGIENGIVEFDNYGDIVMYMRVNDFIYEYKFDPRGDDDE